MSKDRIVVTLLPGERLKTKRCYEIEAPTLGLSQGTLVDVASALPESKRKPPLLTELGRWWKVMEVRAYRDQYLTWIQEYVCVEASENEWVVQRDHYRYAYDLINMQALRLSTDYGVDKESL